MSEIVKLQVGERQFTTNKDTLIDRSKYFAALFNWPSKEPPEDTVFVDRDGDMFEYVLRYLRTSVFPLFYDQINGYDHPKYQMLLAEAQYFQIAKLEEFIDSRAYTKVLKIEHRAEILEPYQANATHEANFKFKYFPTWYTKKIYVCPRGIFIHRGNLNACGRECAKARGDGDIEYEEEQTLRLVELRSELLFDSSVLMDQAE